MRVLFIVAGGLAWAAIAVLIGVASIGMFAATADLGGGVRLGFSVAAGAWTVLAVSVFVAGTALMVRHVRITP